MGIPIPDADPTSHNLWLSHSTSATVDNCNFLFKELAHRIIASDWNGINALTRLCTKMSKILKQKR